MNNYLIFLAAIFALAGIALSIKGFLVARTERYDTKYETIALILYILVLAIVLYQKLWIGIPLTAVPIVVTVYGLRANYQRPPRKTTCRATYTQPSRAITGRIRWEDLKDD